MYVFFFTLQSNWEEWRALRSKSNKQIVPRKVLEFTPLIYDVAGDVVQYFRDHRGVNNYVDSILEPLTDWAFEGINGYIHVCVFTWVVEHILSIFT